MKKLSKLKGVKKISKNAQKQVLGGKGFCPVGCNGLNTMDACFAASGCQCPGQCHPLGHCVPF